MEEQATQTEATVESTDGKTESVTTYVDGKYDSVSALEDGYRNLQKSYSQKLGGFTGAPDEYTLNDGLEANEVLAEWGKENQLSNDGYNTIIDKMRESQLAQEEAFRAEQIERLGENADYRLKNVVDFAKANFGEESIDTFDTMIQTAEGVELMEKIISLTKEAKPAEIKTAPIDADKVKAMRFEIDKNSGLRRMSIDPEFRAKVEKLEAELYK